MNSFTLFRYEIWLHQTEWIFGVHERANNMFLHLKISKWINEHRDCEEKNANKSYGLNKSKVINALDW